MTDFAMEGDAKKMGLTMLEGTYDCFGKQMLLFDAKWRKELSLMKNSVFLLSKQE